MFVKAIPYYNQFCANFCSCCGCAVIDSGVEEGGVVQNGITSNDNNNHSVENGNLKRRPEESPSTMANGTSTSSRNNNSRSRTRVFDKVFRNPPDFARLCCCWRLHGRNHSPSSAAANKNNATDEGDDDDGVDGVTNVVPLDGGTIYTPMKNFIGRDEQELLQEEDGHQLREAVLNVGSRESSAASSSGPTTEELEEEEET